MTESELLREINADLPQLDWQAGAKAYIEQARSSGQFATYSLTKPFLELQSDSPSTALATILEMFRNFANVLELLQLPAGARVLDVGCGGGWLSHYLAKLGYHATGVDICEDLLEMARQRIEEDRHLRIEPEFVAADIEREPIKYGEFEAAIFESCFHHFQNPIAALRHVVESLTPEGVVVLTENECRQGPLKEEWIAEMLQYQTIERPYTRAQLIQILELAGLPCYEFFGPVDGWFSPRSAESHRLSTTAAAKAALQNRCVAARTPQALRRVIPWWEKTIDIEFAQGFSPGSSLKYWCGPQGQIKINQDISDILFLIGGQPTQRQTIAVYHRGRRREVCLIKPDFAPERIRLTSLHAGDEIHLCSDYAFSPSWQGQQDSRLLSFWVERVS
jgi:2-polyprenyl-3-methyl-5-hydroxy-6-metoxy-1,4-benzoquinol methylase